MVFIAFFNLNLRLAVIATVDNPYNLVSTMREDGYTGGTYKSVPVQKVEASEAR